MSSTFLPPPLDFDVLKEIWNKHELADHSFLKVKVVLITISRASEQQQGQGSAPVQQKYDFGFQQIVVVLTNERGPPDNRQYTPAELQASVIKDDIRFNTVTQDWNEYVVDDGTRVKIQPIIMRVAKTSKFNNRGEPIYWVEINMTVQVKPPKSLPPPTS
jgi:hypothetical protein